MSLKSIIFSIFAVLLFYGLVITTIVLFGIDVILGIVGIVLTLTIPPILVRRAISSANGVIDKLLARIVVPILYLVGLGAILLTYFLAL